MWADTTILAMIQGVWVLVVGCERRGNSCQPHSEASPERVTFVVRLSTQMPNVAELPRINALAW